ncbi:MAG: DUF3037 domain-containing protein [Melioribacteraceae bacterium]|nr:DUF3037 domain-containing protein [Melioribacteraceae bacterium]MCF8354848.1 DUF3037 domain-containing protein [Melioribacteraceae bacterium]MCF8392955.1 DUF3037 domain-containing protein [Melioribacteraceae bacterium]MCF8417302.1 DUF3037 domain-containing protein [Melioribacteraceae bacterium]
MKSYVSIIKYYPDTSREEGFGVGIVVVDSFGKESRVRFSNERIKRINSAFGLKKSKLLGLSIDEYSREKFDKRQLEYLADYTNGSLRFSKPDQFVTDDLNRKFEELYSKYISDYSELDESKYKANQRSKHNRVGQKLRNHFLKNPVLNQRLDIGYDFKEDKLNKLLIGSSFIDFIGGNGTVFCGDVLNLDVEEYTLQRNFYKILTLFEALEKEYTPINKFDPRDCKILLLKEHVDRKENADYMERIFNWHKKADYGILIKNEIEDFEKEIAELVDKKGIIKFQDWRKTLDEDLIG